MDTTISQDTDENMEEPCDWSQECLEYFYDNKIWFPDFVRSSSALKTYFF